MFTKQCKSILQANPTFIVRLDDFLCQKGEGNIIFNLGEEFIECVIWVN